MAFQRPFLISLRREDSREPWGFRLDGGGVTNRPVTVQQVLERSLAEKAGLHDGDQVIQVGRLNVQGRTLSEVQELILTCRNRVELFIIREDLLRDRRENEPLTVKAVVHSPYNSPLQLYSQDNVAETLATQALILSDPDVQPNHLGPKSPPTVIHSNVLDALREQGEKGSRLNGEIVTTPPRKKKQPPPVPPKPHQPPSIPQSPPSKAATHPDNMEQVQYQNYSTYHREEKRTSQRTSSYGDYEDEDTSSMYPQQKMFKSQTSFTPQSPDATVRSQPQQIYQQESRLRDYQQQREEEIRRAELARQQELLQQQAFEEQQRQLREQQQRQTYEQQQQQRQAYELQQQQLYQQQQQQQSREQQIREQQAREQRAREQQALEQRAREQASREQQAREQQRLREHQARVEQERLAAQQRLRYEQQQQTREAQARQQSQAQLQARQYEQQRLAEQRKAQEAYELQRQAQPRPQQPQWQPHYYAPSQPSSHHEMDHHKKLTSTARVVPANLGSPTSQRRGGCCPSWPPKNSSVRELPRTGFSPAFVQERGSKEFVWPPPKPEDMIFKEPIPHVHGHAGEAWHPQETTHVSRSLVPRSPTPTRRCGDAIWPPPHVQAAEASGHNRPAPHPVCRRGKFDDYVSQNTISNVPPTYRVPPGTVHVVY